MHLYISNYVYIILHCGMSLSKMFSNEYMYRLPLQVDLSVTKPLLKVSKTEKKTTQRPLNPSIKSLAKTQLYSH